MGESVESDEAPLESAESDEAPLESVESDEAPLESVESDEAPLESLESDEAPLESLESDEDLESAVCPNHSDAYKSAESDEAHSDAHCKPLESTEAPPLESFDSDALTFEEEELVRSLSPLTPPSELADLEPHKFEIAASTKSHQNSLAKQQL